MVAERGTRPPPERVELSVEQRNLQPAVYKNADGSRRASGRIITSVECVKSNEQQAIHAKEYAVNLEVELQKVRDGILTLVDESLILPASTGEPRDFCYEMKGDYHRFLVDVSMMSQRQEAMNQKEGKTLEVPQIQYQEVNRHVTVPKAVTQEVVRQVYVPQPYPEHVDVPRASLTMQTTQKTMEVPQVQYIDQIVDLPVVMQCQIPAIQAVQKAQCRVLTIQITQRTVGSATSSIP